MRYINITRYDIANGPGIRVVLWTSGCSHHCPGCHNENTWDENEGKIFDESALSDILNALNPPYINGLTFSGGDPLYINNRDEVYNIAKCVKEKYPNKSIWLYTGYLYEEISELAILDYIDVLVDGEFLLDQRNIILPYCGSNNQRVIDLKKTKEAGDIVLWINPMCSTEV